MQKGIKTLGYDLPPCRRVWHVSLEADSLWLARNSNWRLATGTIGYRAYYEFRQYLILTPRKWLDRAFLKRLQHTISLKGHLPGCLMTVHELHRYSMTTTKASALPAPAC